MLIATLISLGLNPRAKNASYASLSKDEFKLPSLGKSDFDILINNYPKSKFITQPQKIEEQTNQSLNNLNN